MLQMITFIPGGKGSLKLIRAFRNLLYDNEITVIAGTSDSVWTEGNLFCPSLDNIIHLFSGNLNTGQWEGIKGDTYSTSNLIKKISGDCNVLPVGDKERAMCIVRSNILRNGGSITQSTEQICKYFNITSSILPATDSRYSAYAEIDRELLTMTEFRRLYDDDCDSDLRSSVKIDCKKTPVLSDSAEDAINSSEAVIIGPGRMNTTVFPVLACRNLTKLLDKMFVVSLLPKVPADYSPEKYPSYMKTVSNLRSFSDILIQDIREADEIPGSVRLNTSLDSAAGAESLAWEIMSCIRN
ncbi:LPPG:FO 2-phospho-L-lactate transferase [Methanomicrobium sp. W14]|uniref:2-phospho-L-lactate transferase CofD family protein n=1 Tax=Methanomicrobium sp. W14 TaxID=2817839 RepID=UPI001AE6978B|nr:2-phospho-L-lactate transferase CofD family protein [Methanomicrobium sp. W14]MBP2132899.1 LPPG:FO 2-phospho-L-lactate transferase [Methanomicrobium sp. W14]